MPVTIGSNIAALRVGRLLDESSAALSRNYERLSSGARINRASDDAAGLSVSSALFSKARVLSRAQQNLGDATSLLQIADGALGELSTLVTRMAELAQQAANGTYSSTQRRSLDNEYAQLDREIRRIGASTTFNGLNLLRGSIATNGWETIATDADASAESLAISDDGRYAVIRTGNDGAQAKTYALRDLESGATTDITALNGYSVLRAVVSNGGDIFVFANDGNIYRAAAGSQSTTRLTNSQTPFDLLENTYLAVSGDGTRLNFAARTNYVNGATVASASGSSGSSTFYSIDLTSGVVTRQDTTGTVSPYFATAYGNLSADGRYSWGATGTRIGRWEYTSTGTSYREIDLGAGVSTSVLGIDRSGRVLFTSSQNVTGQNSSLFGQVFAWDPSSGSVTQLSSFRFNSTFSASSSVLSSDGTLFSFYSNADHAGEGTNGVTQAFTLDLTTGVIEQLTKSSTSILTGTLAASRRLARDGSRLIATDSSASNVMVFDFSRRASSFDFEAGFGAAGRITADLSSIRTAVKGLGSYWLSSASSARAALDRMNSNLVGINTARGAIGASLSRIEVANNLTGIQADTIRQADGRIRDADIAAESAELVRRSILQNIGSSLLAQASQQPQLALQLL